LLNYIQNIIDRVKHWLYWSYQTSSWPWSTSYKPNKNVRSFVRRLDSFNWCEKKMHFEV